MRHSVHTSLIELHARQMRSCLNDAERALWAELRAGRLGAHFKRQVVFGKFIVDFVAPAARLVVEVDGPYHTRRRSADARRDRRLARLGYRVLRLEAALVLEHPDQAVARIRAALAEQA